VTQTPLDELRIERGASARPARRRRRPWVKWAALVLVLATGSLLFRQQIAALGLPAVKVERVVARDAAAVAAATGASANGYIVARTRAALSADTPGRIVELNVAEGSVVKKGDVVARLFADEYAAALRRAEADFVLAQRSEERARAEVESSRRELETLRANVAAVQADLDQRKASLQLAQLSFDRAKRLLEAGVDTADRRDRAERDLLDAQAGVQAGSARVEAAQKALAHGEARLLAVEAGVPEAAARVVSAAAARDLAAATLDKTAVRAPFDGVVVLKDAEVGEVVSPNSQGGSNARGSVVTMVDFATLEVQAEVPETSISTVHVGGVASIYLDAFPTKPYAGRVDRVWPTANRTKATNEVRVVFLERDERLRPEMGVRVVFGGGAQGTEKPAEANVLVPVECVVRAVGRPGVFVVERDVLRWQTVTTGAERAGKVAVLSGLSGGEEIVVAPGSELTDGARVRVERPEG
jgi:RND family efflux transporter MFP subunit